jgi:group I intron endonuclease
MIGIYKITNLTNGKSYVGQSVHIERRWTEHCLPSANSLIAKAIQKYGKEQFTFQVVEECAPEQLDEKEEYYISHFNTVTPNGYNVMDWVDGHATYFNIDKEVLENLFNDIQNSEMSFDAIGEKYDLSRRTIIRINQGHTHFCKEKEYPLRKKSEELNKYCVDCGVKIAYGATRCRTCHDKHQRVVERPSREELKQLIRTTPFTTIGKQYGVSDNAVRKWCKIYNLPSKSSEIKKIGDSEWMEM